MKTVQDEEAQALISEEPRGGMQITMRDVSYTIWKQRKGLRLLDGITGYLNPGQMTALIGPSGSGKTTLVDVLAGRKTQGEMQGEILYSNQTATRGLLRKYVGYVEQFDVLIDYLTVYEMLMYTAELKRPFTESREEKAAHVATLLRKLLLVKCKDMKIGNQGGVKKRLNIGITLISQPKVLFLDEPTTGVDSYTANETMKVVKEMAISDGTTICSTIHAPTPYTFSLFDRVLFILGGQVVFFGETSCAAQFLGPFGMEMRHDYDNVADWLTVIIVKADREAKGPEMTTAFSQSYFKQETDRYLNGVIDKSRMTTANGSTGDPDLENGIHSPLHHVLRTLFKYRVLKNIQEPSFWISRTADKLVFTFLLVITYSGVGDDFTYPDFQNVVSVLFMLVCFPLFAAGIYAPTIVLERSLLYRELDDGLYTSGIYLLMKFVAELIPSLIQTAVITNIAWELLALQGNRVYFYLIYFGNLLNGITTAYVAAAVGSNVNMCNAFMMSYTAILLFFCGMLILPRDIPGYLKWLYYLDYPAYGFAVLMKNTFTSSEAAKDAGYEGFLSIPVLEYYELDDVNKRWSTFAIYLFGLGHFFVAYVCTRFIRHQKR